MRVSAEIPTQYPLGGFVEGLRASFRPRSKLKLSEWAEQNIVLPSERAASPGPFRFGDAQYQRGMMDAVTDPDTSIVVFMTSAQVGKSTILAAIEGYYSEYEPSPQLSVFPTDEVATDYLTESFDPMVKESPSLKGLYRTKKNSRLFTGGYIAFVSANNPRDLAARPIRIAKVDEVDRCPRSSGKEGSPIDLVWKRTTTYSRRGRKLVLASTPTLKSLSQIITWFDKSDKRYFHVVCDECNHAQPLKWQNVIYEKGREAEAHYLCDGCGVLWSEQRKRRLVRDAESMGGGWIATKPGETIVGFHISELYSPWSSMATMAEAWSRAEGNPELEQTFYNTSLGLPYEGDIASFADWERLSRRREPRKTDVLNPGVGLLTAGVDVQDDRIEALVTGWGAGDECWLVERVKILKDPSVPSAWADLEEFLLRKFRHPAGGGGTLGIEAVGIDSGGHFTQTVYAFAAKHKNRRWNAIRGVPGEKRVIWELSKARLKGGAKLYLVGVDDAKTTIYKRLAIDTPGPGYVHIPEHFDDDALKQVTAEHAEVDYVNGFPVRKWVKERSARNEMLDMFVYSYAVRCSLNIDVEARLQKWNAPQEPGLDAYEVGKLYK